jgi:hypothetical protein
MRCRVMFAGLTALSNTCGHGHTRHTDGCRPKIPRLTSLIPARPIKFVRAIRAHVIYTTYEGLKKELEGLLRKDQRRRSVVEPINCFCKL